MRGCWVIYRANARQHAYRENPRKLKKLKMRLRSKPDDRFVNKKSTAPEDALALLVIFFLTFIIRYDITLNKYYSLVGFC